MSNVELVLDKEFQGPTMAQLAPILTQYTVEDAINVPWTHTKDEIRLLEQFPKLKFCLHIAEPNVLDRAIAAFGLRLKLSPSLIERARIVLTDPTAYDWRKFVNDQIPGINPRYVLLQLCADAIRKGKQPSLAQIIDPLFLDSISPLDADVLLRLKSNRLRG